MTTMAPRCAGWGIVVILVTAAAAMAAPAGTWDAKAGSDGQTVETSSTATIGGLRVDAFLSLLCNRTGAPAAWLDLTIAEADKVTKTFDLSPFEGPDAPAQSRALVAIELVGSKGQSLSAHQSGWYSAEHDGGFGFGVGGSAKESKALAAIIKRMAREGTALRIHVSSFGEPRRTIIAEFPLSGSRQALMTLSKHCR